MIEENEVNADKVLVENSNDDNKIEKNTKSQPEIN